MATAAHYNMVWGLARSKLLHLHTIKHNKKQQTYTNVIRTQQRTEDNMRLNRAATGDCKFAMAT